MNIYARGKVQGLKDIQFPIDRSFSPSNQVGSWAATNPADIKICTTKGHNFVIEAQPAGNFIGGKSFQDSLTVVPHTEVERDGVLWVNPEIGEA
jgi:hypothetical protein